MSRDVEELIRETLHRRASLVSPPNERRDAGGSRSVGRGQKLATVAVALGLAVAGFALVVSALGPRNVSVALSPTPSRAAKVVNAELSATISTKGEATSVSTGASGVWVAVPEMDGSAGCGGAVERIDPTTNALTGVFPIGATPTAVQVSTDLVWVATRSCSENELPSLLALAPRDGHVIASVELPVANGTAFRMTSSEGRVWLAIANPDSDKGAVIAVDEASYGIAQQIPIEGRLRDVAVSGSAIWVVDDTFERTALLRVDTATGAVTRLFEGSVDVRSGFALAGTPSGVWISLGSTDASLVDESGVRTASEFRIPGGFGPFAANDAGVWFWGLDMTSNRQVISWLDAQTGTVKIAVPLPSAPVSAALEGDVVWVALSGGGVARVDFVTSST
jgi:hypothetical protein